MRQAIAFFFLFLLASHAVAGNLYPMEAGTLRRENHSLDLTTAATPMTLVWTGAGCYSEPCSNPVILSDRVVQATRIGVICRALCDGQTLWSWPAQDYVGLLWNPPFYDSTHNLLYQSALNGSVVALSPSNGQPQWSIYEGAFPGIRNQASVTYYNDMIYYGNANQSFVCINADTRAQIWRFNFSQPQGAVTPAIDGGFIYLAGSRGEIACLNATTGAVQWDIQTSCFRVYTSAILLNDTNLYVMTAAGLVECRNRTTGAVVWTYQTQSYAEGNLSIGDDLYCTSDDRCIYKLDLNTGAVLFQTCFAGNFARSGPFYCGGLIFASGCANVDYGVDSTGNTVFSYNEGTDNSFADWAESNGLLYVTNRVGVMSCFSFAGVTPPTGCTPTFTPSISPTWTPTQRNTSTATPSISPTATPSASPTMTPSASPTETSSASPTETPSESPTPSYTSSPTVSSTSTNTPTLTPSASMSPTRTISATPTISRTAGYDSVPPGDDPTGIGPTDAGCYPNPVKGGSCHFVYQMNGPGSSRIRVYRADGVLCGDYSFQHASGGLKDVPCDLSSYASGVYFFLVDRMPSSGSEDTTTLEKFIVIR